MKTIRRALFLEKILYWVYRIRSKKIIANIGPILDGRRKIILDIGSGTGCISEILQENHEVKLIDIKDISLKKELEPLVFDGKKIPFVDSAFDVALLITVLHHTKNPEQLLLEAKRVSSSILVIEDVFSSKAGFYWDCFMDSLINFEIINHPHSNKSDLEWKQVFGKFGLKLEKCFYVKSHFGFRHAVYYLSR